MMKKLLSILLAVLLTLTGVTALHVSIQATETGNTAQYAQDTVDGGAVLHCFNWSFNSIRAKLQQIHDAGYTAVQTSPVQPPKDYSSSYTDMSGQWWKLYQPLGLRIADTNNWLGTKAELRALCTEAHRYGIKVIVDIVANHVANNGTDGGTYSNINTGLDSNLKSSALYHTNANYINDDNRFNMTQRHMNMPDLNTANSTVQNLTLGLLEECVGCGVDGFRFDAAKHIELPTDDSSFASNFWPNVLGGVNSVRSGLFHYGEILGTAGTDIGNYTKYMSITDNYTGDKSLYAANTDDCAELADPDYHKGADPAKSVLWVESHDTYMRSTGSAGYQNTAGVTDASVIRAWAITGSRADSTSLFFARPNSTMGQPSSNETWKSAAVTEINKFKNFFDGTSEYLASNATYHAAYNERGTSGVVISKLNGGGAVKLTANRMAAGTYTDQLTGNTFTVANGKISGTVGSTGVAVVYNPEDDPQPTEADELDYYLFGWIEGSDYACNDDWQNLGDYHFVNGQLTATFTQDAYVAVKSVDGEGNMNWYMTDGWLGNVTSATLYNTGTLSTPNKLFVPANTTLYFTLTVNADDTLVLSYSDTPPATEAPTTEEPTTAPETLSYYLFGYIDGANYACEDDWENLGDYQFVNGQLTTTFAQDAYVAVKSVDGSGFMNWYMTDGWQGFVDAVTLYNTAALTETNKLFVPANQTVTFTLTVDAANDTLHLSYTAEEPTTEEPTTVPQVPVLLGDIDGDGVTNIADATLVQMYCAEYLSFTRVQKAAADVNRDGNVTVADVTCIQRWINDDTEAGDTGATVEIPEHFTLTLTNSLGWEGDICCYYWSDTDTQMVEWNGVPMTAAEQDSQGQALYTVTLPYTVEYVIFSNDDAQTEDVPVSGADAAYTVTDQTNAFGSYLVEAC